MKTEFGRRAFSSAAAQIWNQTSLHHHSTVSCIAFKPIISPFHDIPTDPSTACTSDLFKFILNACALANNVVTCNELQLTTIHWVPSGAYRRASQGVILFRYVASLVVRSTTTKWLTTPWMTDLPHTDDSLQYYSTLCRPLWTPTDKIPLDSHPTASPSTTRASYGLIWFILLETRAKAKDDIAHKKRNLIDIIYHVRQVAARVAKLIMRGVYGTSFWGRGGRGGQRLYHSKERRGLLGGPPYGSR